MASVGTAHLNVVPKFDNLSATVNRAMGAVDLSKSGRQMGDSLSGGVSKSVGGLARQGALVGIFSSVTTKAMDEIGAHVGSAVSRLDTMKNYPTVMQSLGYSAEDSQASIDKMSDRLSTLPTTLNGMVGNVQMLTSTIGDLGKATDVGLALNDMFLAAGASSDSAALALTQYNQMLATGKVDMQSWNSVVQTAPGQVDQLAKSLLGASAGQSDLYQALKDGTVSMSDLNDAVVRLDREGGQGFESFQKQAESATGGIQTAAENMSNAVTKGIAGVMDAVGRDTIAGIFNDIKGGINGISADAADIAAKVTPGLKATWNVVKDLAGDLKPLAPLFAGAVTAGLGFKAVSTVFNAVSVDMKSIGSMALGASEHLLSLGANMSGPLAEGALNGATGLSSMASVLSGPWGIAIAAGATGLTLLIGHLIEVEQRQKALTDSVSAFSDVTAGAAGLESYSGSIADIGKSAELAGFDVEGFTETMNTHTGTMRSNIEAAQSSIATWQTVQTTIDDLAGKTSLTSEEQGRLKWALDQVNEATGESISLEEALTGQYTDQNGEVQNLKDTVDDLAQSRIQAAKTQAYTENLTEAYKAQQDAADGLTRAQNDYNSIYQQTYEANLKNTDAARQYGVSVQEYAKIMADATIANTEEGRALTAARDAYDEANGAVDEYSRLLGQSTAAEQDAADGVEAIKSALGGLGGDLDKAFVESGTSVSEFAQACADAGISTDELRTIGTDNLSALADQCGGDVGKMVDAILTYNDTPILDKDGNISVDATSLWDAQGNLYTWNGTELKDQDGNVVVDDVELTDAQGNLVTWNGSDLVDQHAATSVDVASLIDAQGRLYTWDGSSLVDQDGNAVVNDTDLMDAQGNLYKWNGSRLNQQSGSADVNDQSVQDAISHIQIYNRTLPADHHATTVIDVIRNTWNNIFDNTHSATGSVSNRSYVPRHAEGYIAAGPTLTNNGLVGEDGAEAVLNWGTGGAVVPLTNTKYMRPIAEAIAKEMPYERNGVGNVYNVNIYGAPTDSPEDFARRFVRKARQLQGARG